MRSVLVVCLLLSLASVNLTFAEEPQPAIGFISPAQGATVVGPNVTVEVEITDFTLVPPTGTGSNLEEGTEFEEGHIIYYLDLEQVFMPGQPAIPTDPDAVYAVSDQLAHTFEDVAPGSHDVTVLLVSDNHVPVRSFASDKVSFTVIAPSETPPPEPSPSVAEFARSVSVLTEEATPVPTPTSPPTPTPAVLVAEMPAVGATPSESGGGPTVWLLVAAALGVITVIGGGALAAQMRRRRG